MSCRFTLAVVAAIPFALAAPRAGAADIKVLQDLRRHRDGCFDELAVHVDDVKRAVEINAAGATLLTEAISEMGIRVVPTWANFLFCHVGEEAPQMCHLLQDEGFIVRPMTGPWGAPDAFRITIGTDILPPDM